MIQLADGAAKPGRGQVQRGNTFPITPCRIAGRSFQGQRCAL